MDTSYRILSFGWLVWDILCQVKQEVRLIRNKSIVQSLDPLSESASEVSLSLSLSIFNLVHSKKFENLCFSF